MNLTFEPMTRELAGEIAAWRYPAPYQRYGYTDDDSRETVARFVDPRYRFFAGLEGGDLIAFRSFGEDGQVRGGDYAGDFLDTGGGLRPDLTGRGLGPAVITQGLAFGHGRFGTCRFRVTVADFNRRALRACEKVGFQPIQHFRRESDGEPFTVLVIDLGAVAPPRRTR